MPTRFRQLTLLGPGLLGGSIGLAARKRKIAKKVVMWGRRLESAEVAVRQGAADWAAPTLGEAVRGADLVVLCTPVGSMVKLTREFRSELTPKTLVTDVASTKNNIVKQLSKILMCKAPYIGSHPMAGAEREGLQSARSTLFEGAVCILTPQSRVHKMEMKRLADFWRALGCRIRVMTPAEHDKRVAYISHVPHLVAAAMVNGVSRRKASAFDCIGNGFRDMTRIASGSAEMWSEIVLSNRKEIQQCVGYLMEELEIVRRYITHASEPELRAYLRRARRWREKFRHCVQDATQT